jgi:hypothetical protein
MDIDPHNSLLPCLCISHNFHFSILTTFIMMITQAKKRKVASSDHHSIRTPSHIHSTISPIDENTPSMSVSQAGPITSSLLTYPSVAASILTGFGLPSSDTDFTASVNNASPNEEVDQKIPSTVFYHYQTCPSVATFPSNINLGMVPSATGLKLMSSVNSFSPVTNVSQDGVSTETRTFHPVARIHPVQVHAVGITAHPVAAHIHQASCTTLLTGNLPSNMCINNPITTLPSSLGGIPLPINSAPDIPTSSYRKDTAVLNDTMKRPDTVTSLSNSVDIDNVTSQPGPIMCTKVIAIKQEEDESQYDCATPSVLVPIKQEEDEYQLNAYNGASDIMPVVEEDSSNKPFLSLDIIKSSILQYLDPRTLLNVSYTCKELNDAVTVPMALTSAMMIGGHSLTSMTVLYELMKKASIYPPKAKRILLISVGRICELCKDNNVSHLRRGHGVFACWDCVRNRYTGCIRKEGDLFESNPIACNRVLSHPRVARRLSEWRHVQEHIQEESELAKASGILHHVLDADGTPVHLHGSLTVKDMQNFIWTKRLTDTEGDGVGPILLKDMLLALCEEARMISPTERCLINEKLEALGAPSASDSRYEDFVQTYEANISIALDKQHERKEQRQMAMDRYVRVRVETARKFISDLMESVDDPNIASFLNYRENINFHNPYLRLKYNQRPIKMCVYWVDKVLREHLKAPSRMNNKRIKQLSNQLKEAYKIKTSKEDLARLRFNHKTLLKWYYIDSDKKTYYYCHD